MARLEETQTTINWDAANKMAEIFTEIPATITKLNKMCEKFPDHYKLVRVDKWGGHHYECPKDRIRFRAPLTEKQSETNRRIAVQHGFAARNAAVSPIETPSTPSDDTE